MICIYSISNKINKKRYIGQTINYYSRKHNHINELARNIHHNSKLQNAFNKYDESNFEINILLECKKGELNDLEIYYIWLFDSFNNGYNLTKGGQDRSENGKETIWNGKAYKSVVLAAKDLDIPATALYARLKNGHVSDTTLKYEYLGRKILWNGEHYSSYRECGIKNNIHPDTIAWRIKRGYNSEKEMIRTSDPKEITINGITYKSVSEAARNLEVDRKTIRRKYLNNSYANLTKP